MTPPEAMANRAGCLPMAPPIAAKRAPFGSCCHALDGQNTRVPRSETMAGMRGSPATSVAATAMARAGPSALKSPKGGEGQREEGDDHRARCRGDRLPDAGDGADHCGLRVFSGSKSFPEAEHQ